jgi:hypothetical protein
VSAGLSADRARSDAALAAWYLSAGARFLWNVPLLAGLLICLALLMLRGPAEDPQANLLATQAELESYNPSPIPPAEDAAGIYTQAAAVTVPFSGEVEDNPLYWYAYPSQALEAPQVKAHLAANANAIQLLYAAAQKDRCNWGFNYAAGYFSGMPNLMQLREWAWLLVLHARVSAHAGQHDEAAKALCASRQLSRHLGEDPGLLPLAIASAMEDETQRGLEAIVLWDTPGKVDDARRYRAVLAGQRPAHERFARTVRYERACGLNLMDRMACGQPPPGMPRTRDFYPGSGVSAGWYGAERHCYDEVMRAQIEMIKRGEVVQDGDLERLFEKHQRGPAFTARRLATNGPRLQIGLNMTEDLRRAGDAALACLLFRLEKGRDPGSLDELVPQYLPAVPRDTFHGHPLRLRRDPVGTRVYDGRTSPLPLVFPGLLRVYSLGSDGRDSNGFDAQVGEGRFDPSATDPYQDDTVFRIPPAGGGERKEAPLGEAKP